MNLPFEYELDPPEYNRKSIPCEKCGNDIYYENSLYEQDDCYFYDGKYYCADCICDVVKEDTYMELSD